jgi:hypothetical protein
VMVGKLVGVLFLLHLRGGAPSQISGRFQNSRESCIQRPPTCSCRCAPLQHDRNACCSLSKQCGPVKLRLRGGEEAKFVNLVADVYKAPEGYDDLFPCPEGDETLGLAEEALKVGDLSLARKLQQTAVDYYNRDFAMSKNLNAIESLDRRIGIVPIPALLCK